MAKHSFVLLFSDGIALIGPQNDFLYMSYNSGKLEMEMQETGGR